MNFLTYRERDIPCFGCDERYIGCHGKCDRYASYHAKQEEEKKRIFQEKENMLAAKENVRNWAKRSGKYLRNVYF